MAPRSLLSVGLAALATALFAVPAGAQELRATRAVPLVDGPAQSSLSVAATTDGFLAAWGITSGVQLRTLDASGAPSGPVRTVVIGGQQVSAAEIVVLPGALVTVE